MSLAPIPKSQLLLDLIRREFPAYHPLLSIARIAHDHNADLKLQFECHKTIAKYIEPELKSIELKGIPDGGTRVTVSLFDALEGQFSEVDENGEIIEQASEYAAVPLSALGNW